MSVRRCPGNGFYFLVSIHCYELPPAFAPSGGSGTSYSEAGSLTDDVVLSQTQTDYDGDGNVIETITKDRFNTDSTSSYGALGTPTTGVEARVYYSGNYYDLADRLTASVNVGTNEGSAWSMPDSCPVPNCGRMSCRILAV